MADPDCDQNPFCKSCVEKVKQRIYEVVEEKTLRKAVKVLLEKGLMPLNSEEVWKLKEAGKIPMEWYNTGTLFFEGKFRDVTLKELKNIGDVYDKGGRLLCVGPVGNNYSDAYGSSSLGDYDGRLVGVKPKKVKQK